MTYNWYDDIDDGRERCCPKCDEYCRVSQPAEPDVGIMGDLWSCPTRGDFYENDSGKLVFADDGATR